MTLEMVVEMASAAIEASREGGLVCVRGNI